VSRTAAITAAEKLIAARQATHGDFCETGAVAQGIKTAFGAERAALLSPVQRAALDQIATKIARILCGDPNHPDHWHDVAGYARLGAPPAPRAGR
jgi:hypothetical protein